jgi:hypothetical protein
MNMPDRPIRLVLHPGHPKCGSSSIQHALRLNTAALAERGVFVPPRRPNRIFIQACERQQFVPVEEWLLQLLARARKAGCDTLVISSENLGVRQLVTNGRPIHQIFARHLQPVDVVYYIRRQDDWIVSMWQQWGHKAGKSLTQYTDERLGFHEPVFLAATRLFEEVYGSDRITVVPLERQALVGEDLIVDFSHRAAVGPLEVEDDERYKNPSMSGFLCDVLARVPHVYDQTLVARVAEGRTDTSIRHLLDRWVFSPHLLFSGDKRIMSLEERRRVMAHFEDDNRTLHERYFRDVPFNVVFGLPAHHEEEAHQALRDEMAGLKDVVAIQMELIVKLLRDAESGQKRGYVSTVKRWGRRLRSVCRSVRRRKKGWLV